MAESDPRLLPEGRQGLPFNAKTIDTLPATSVTTIDLAAKSYQTASGLRNRILQKAQALIEYPEGPRILRVGVPDDVVATAAQQKAMQQAAQRLQAQGVTLEFVPIN